jgi:nitrite reductase (NADH) large subunit
MTRQRLAIIGNGMAAGRLLDELIRKEGPAKYDVSVFGEESHGSYNRILLNRVLEGGSVDEITLKPASWYAEQGVRFLPGQVVSRLSHATRKLWTADGRTHDFDVAVFATGSLPRMPKLEGLRRRDGGLKKGVFAYRTVADAVRMRSHAQPGMKAVIIGGGLLGLEAAKGLVDLGLDVTVVHNHETLMNRQVDLLGGRFLRQAVERLGIAVHASRTTKAVLGAERAEAVELDGDERLTADMIVFASGIKARIELARDSGIPTNHGILVDDRLETGRPGIYAVGECSEHDGTVYGMVQPIYDQCAVLAGILTGATPDARYGGSKTYTKLKVAGIEVAGMGAIEPEHADDEVVQVIESRRHVYRKLILRDGRLAGAVLVGDSSAAAKLVRMLDSGIALPINRLDVFASDDTVSDGGPGNDPEVCNCSRVTKSALIAAIQSGCDSLPRLSAKTRAGTGCGSCRGRLADLILKNSAVGRGPHDPVETTDRSSPSGWR